MTQQHTLDVHWDDIFLDHRPPAGSFSLESSDLFAVDEAHPDTPDRIRNIRHIIERTMADWTTFSPVEPADRVRLEAVHEDAYLDSLAQVDQTVRLTPTTVATPQTYTVARHAAGAAIGAATNAFTDGVLPYALVRPSGHHAQSDRADGFCYLNNVAVAAQTIIDDGRAERVAIIDWDVHHGNGTQEIFYDRDDVLVISLHNDHGSWNADSHPQTGGLIEQGHGVGEGYSVNVPLPFGTGDQGYEYAFEHLIEPVVAQFDPDIVLVSAGQDPGARDPLGRNVVSKTGFKMLGERVRRLADSQANGALAFVQEGGYQVTHLAIATLGVLEGALGVEASFDGFDMNLQADPFAWPGENLDVACEWIDDARKAHAEHWDLDVS